MVCVANFKAFQQWKDFENRFRFHLSYREFKGANFFETQCTYISVTLSMR